MAFVFEKLLVYQKSVDVADAVCEKTEQFTRGYGFLVNQLNRASLSISANIAEGNGRFTKADRKNFFGIVSKLKAVFSVVLILGVMATGATFLACRTAAGQDNKKPSIEKPLEPAAKQVTVTFLAGAKKIPLGGLKVTIRKDTGHWTDDQKAKPLTGGKTDKEGTARFTLSDGSYYVAITSEKELPYLGIHSSIIKVGKDTAFDFNLADACKLTLRAVDETGKGIPGVSFMMMSETAEYNSAVVGDNLGADHKKQGKEVTDKDGYLTRSMAPHAGYTYFAWPTPKGYDTGEVGIEIPTPLGKASAEHVFKFRRIRFAADEQSAAEGRQFKTYTQKIHNTDVSFDMVAIAGGEFTMGSPDVELGRGVDEGPQHRVRVQSFWMGKCEVTWDEFELWSAQTRLPKAKRKEADPSSLDSKADAVTRPTLPYADWSYGMGIRGCPVICVSQHAAKKYCEWLSAKTGLYYRLPTEAEWEYACRAGTTTAYSFGDDPSLLDDYAWHDGNCEADGEKKYHPVGLKKPNPWGLHDMHGNVAEWVQDKYEAGFYKASPADQVAESPLCVAKREYPRVTRGGSWMSQPSLTRSAVRQPSTEKWKESDPQSPPSAWYITDAPFVGFRVVRPLRTPTLDERKSQLLDAVVPVDAVERGRTD